MDSLRKEDSVWEYGELFRGYMLVSVEGFKLRALVAAFNGKVRVYEPSLNKGAWSFERTINEPYFDERFEELAQEDEATLRIAINKDAFDKIINNK
jgi:hypothetical protein